MRFSFDLDENRIQKEKKFWKKPWITKFLNNSIRKNVSSYPNYWRFVWWKFDITLEWGSELKKEHGKSNSRARLSQNR